MTCQSKSLCFLGESKVEIEGSETGLAKYRFHNQIKFNMTNYVANYLKWSLASYAYDGSGAILHFINLHFLW